MTGRRRERLPRANSLGSNAINIQMRGTFDMRTRYLRRGRYSIIQITQRHSRRLVRTTPNQPQLHVLIGAARRKGGCVLESEMSGQYVLG